MFYNYQFGLRKSHYTSHAIITLVERVSKALDMGKYVVDVFLDLKRLSTLYTILFFLENYGTRGKTLRWVESYLPNKSQYVEHNHSKSDTKCITYSVPQGSILGPLLFIIYMNDFSMSSDLLFYILYSDGT